MHEETIAISRFNVFSSLAHSEAFFMTIFRNSINACNAENVLLGLWDEVGTVILDIYNNSMYN